MDKKASSKSQKKMGEIFSQVFERFVGRAKKAKETIEKGRGTAPLLSLESRLNLTKLNVLIDTLSERFVMTHLSPLQQKKVLEIGESALPFQKMLMQKGAQMLCGVVVGEMHGASRGSQTLLQGSFRAIPFAENFFHFVLARLTTPLQGDVISAVKELGRILIPKGGAFIFDFHPYGLFAKSGATRLRSVQATIRGFEDYYKMCRLAGLKIEDVGEGFVDDSIRHLFTTPEELNVFRDIKGTPLVLFLRVVKGSS